MNYQKTYLVTIQYLGFRFHGWQKQPQLKTVHDILDKSLSFVLKGIRYKSLGVGRTDAKVSSTNYAFQLFIDSTVEFDWFIETFNINSPSDLRALKIENIKETFNVIQHPKEKEYRYYFSFGTKNHPYAAPFLTGYQEDLDISLMMEGAFLFEGVHHFKNYCTKPTEHTILDREITDCRIVENTDLQASFFPKTSYVLIVKGKGFLRNQIRLIMGALVELGKNNYDLEFIETSLTLESETISLRNIAPASGLHLAELTFFD